MKIESIQIENFRSFKNEVIYFDNYTCFVGSNGSGKSTILNALNIFFRQKRDTQTDLIKLCAEDFHHKNTEEPIKISVTFCDLSEQAQMDLSDYVRQGKLTVSSIAKYNAENDTAEVKQFGNRLGFEDFRRFFEADKKGAKVDDLKRIYAELQIKYEDLQKAPNKLAMIEMLRKYEASHPKQCVLIPSEDQFYGISRGADKLAPHIQWIFISASKDISEECEESNNSALGQLLSRTIRQKVKFSDKIGALRTRFKTEYQEILDNEQGALDEISTSLKKRLENWSHPGISARVLWKQDSEKSVKVEEPWAFLQIGERGFEGDLLRFGHGLQRSYMLALLLELTSSPDPTSPTLVMAIEEPEIYQHPPQARYLAETLHDLSMKETQVIICSHHPLFIPGDDFESIRIVREKDNPSKSYTSRLKYTELSNLLKDYNEKILKEQGMLAKLYPSLNPIINEMFFCSKLILTEGIEDVAYISTYLILNSKMDIFRRNGCHIVPVGGKDKIIKPLAMAKLLKIPVFVFCDADTDKTRESEVAKHKIENREIQKLLGFPTINEWPGDDIFHNNLVMWKTNLTTIIKNETNEKWDKIKSEVEVDYGQPGGLEKNPLAIARILESLWKDDTKSVLLNKAIEYIINFATTY
jgi:putative ATP-dependent endonuclease of the OLD family